MPLVIFLFLLFCISLPIGFFSGSQSIGLIVKRHKIKVSTFAARFKSREKSFCGRIQVGLLIAQANVAEVINSETKKI